MTTAVARPTPRELIARAVSAGRFDMPLAPDLTREIAGGADVPFERLGLDSLGWMEFCIAIELEGGVELSPSLLAGMRSLSEIEDWLAARLDR